MYHASEVFKRAVMAIIHFGTEQHKSVMQEYGETTEQQKSIGEWLCDYAESRQPFDEIKHRQTRDEIADVANGAYDWKIERDNNGLKR